MNTVASYCAAHGLPYRVKVPSGQGTVFRPNYGTPALCPPVSVPQPEVYVAEIPNATIQPRCETIWAEDELNDLAVRHEGRMPVAPTAVYPGTQIGSSYRGAIVVAEGVMLTHQFAGNWFHWLVEQITRLQFLDVVAPLLVDRGMPAQCYEALAAITNLPLIYVDSQVTVQRLIVLGRLVWLPSDLKPNEPVVSTDVLMAREAIAFLRGLRPQVEGTDKLYVERRGAQRLINKDQVRAFYEGRGFQTVHPEDLTFAQQREVFGRAAEIAGESGGGMTNIVFAPPECQVTIFQVPIEWNLYACLAGHGGQKAAFVNGAPIAGYTGYYYQSPYHIDPAML